MSHLQYTINEYRRRLRQHEQQAELALEHAYQQVLATIKPRLDKLYDEMVKKLGDGDKIPVSWLYEANRLENLKAYIEEQMSHYGMLANMTVGQMQHQSVVLGQESALALLTATKPPSVKWTFGVPSDKAIANIVGATQAGSPLADLFEGFGREAAQKAGQALIQGIVLGDNPRKVASDVQQSLGVSRNRALTISRTEGLRAYRSANLATFQQNSDVVNGWIWSAALGTACAACTAMNGTKHSLDEDMGTHPNCRCVQLPETKGWDEILGNLGIDSSGITDTTIEVQSGSDWFAQQDATTQQSILGSKAAYDLYKSGDADLSDFVGWNESDGWGRSIRQKSVKELVKR